MSDKPTKAQMEAYIEAGYTVADISADTSWSVSKVRYWLKKFGLKASRETKSIGHKAFKTILARSFPTYPIQEEYHLGQRFRLDFYIPNLYTGFEIDGTQHDSVQDFFHSGSLKEFEKQVQRDSDKEHMCKNKGILLIRIPASVVQQALKDGQVAAWLMKDIVNRISKHEPPEPATTKQVVTSPTYNAYRERMKSLGRESRKANYRRQKELKKKLSMENNAKKALSG